MHHRFLKVDKVQDMYLVLAAQLTGSPLNIYITGIKYKKEEKKKKKKKRNKRKGKSHR